METIYLANLKESEEFGNDLLKGAICIDDFLAAIKKKAVKDAIYIYEGKRYINIDVVKRKTPKFGKSHFAKLNLHVPGANKSSKQEDSTASTTSTRKNVSAKEKV